MDVDLISSNNQVWSQVYAAPVSPPRCHSCMVSRPPL